MKPTRILLAGEGGQGIQTIAKVISEAAFLDKKEVTYIPSFGVEQRGTPSVAFITIGEEQIHYPRFDAADWIFVLQKRAVKVVAEYVSAKTMIVFDSSTVLIKDLPKNSAHISALPATQEAYEKFIPHAYNIIIIGKIASKFNLDREIVWQTIEKYLGKKFKTAEIRQKNLDAYNFGYDATLEFEDYTEAKFVVSESDIVFKGHGRTAIVVPKRCKGCGICIFKCPVAALSWSEELGVFATPVPKCDTEKCITCGNCFRFCPDCAIRVTNDPKIEIKKD